MSSVKSASLERTFVVATRWEAEDILPIQAFYGVVSRIITYFSSPHLRCLNGGWDELGFYLSPGRKNVVALAWKHNPWVGRSRSCLISGVWDPGSFRVSVCLLKCLSGAECVHSRVAKNDGGVGFGTEKMPEDVKEHKEDTGAGELN